MTAEELATQGEQSAKEGKSAVQIAQYLVGQNVLPDVALQVANQLVREHGPKPVLPTFDGWTLLNQELFRLNQIFYEMGREVYDPSKVWATVEEWSEGITENLLMFWREEHEPMEFSTGTRVRRVESENYVFGSSVIAFGEIVVNHFRYLLEQNPYEDLTSARSEEQIVRLKCLGGLHMVQWYDKNGERVCITFSRGDQLVKLLES